MVMVKSGRRENVQEMVYGAHALIELVRARRRRILTIYTTKPEPKSWQRVKEVLGKNIPSISYVSRDVLDRMAGCKDHMGVIAVVTPFPYRSKSFDPVRHQFLLLLDAVQDVRNLGAILRSAYCVGVDGVVLCKTNAAPLTAAALKASAGLAEHLEITIAPSLTAAAQELKRSGYTLYMAVLEGGVNALEVTYQSPCALVIGNEATGITKEVQRQGQLITIPQRRPDISYNASVAAGILLFVMGYVRRG